jgi:hypothetical protein
MLPIGRVVRDLVDDGGLEHRAIAEAAGLDSSALSRFIAGKRCIPLDRLKRLLTSVGCRAPYVPMAISLIPYLTEGDARVRAVGSGPSRLHLPATKASQIQSYVQQHLNAHRFLRLASPKRPVLPHTLSIAFDVRDPNAFLADVRAHDQLLYPAQRGMSGSSGIRYELCYATADRLTRLSAIPSRRGARYGLLHVADLERAEDLAAVIDLVWPHRSGAPVLTELHLAFDYATGFGSFGVRLPSRQHVSVSRFAKHARSGIVREHYLRIGPPKRPVLVCYTDVDRPFTRVERRLLGLDLPLPALAARSNLLDDLELYDLRLRRLPHPSYQLAVVNANHDMHALHALSPEIANALLVPNDPNHPRALLQRHWHRTLRWLAARLNLEPSVLGLERP